MPLIVAEFSCWSCGCPGPGHGHITKKNCFEEQLLVRVLCHCGGKVCSEKVASNIVRASARVPA